MELQTQVYRISRFINQKSAGQIYEIYAFVQTIFFLQFKAATACAGKLFMLFYQFNNASSNFHWTGSIRANQTWTIMASKIKN